MSDSNSYVTGELGVNVELGWTYKFVFRQPFDILNNIFTIVKIYAYDELVEEGIDLFEVLYNPLTLPQEQFDNDFVLYNFKEQRIFKLRSVEDIEDVLYVPESIISEQPNFNVKKYNKLVLALNIGVYPGAGELEYIKNRLADEFAATLGYALTPELQTDDNIKDELTTVAIDEVWLTDDEYNAYKEKRNANKHDVVNYFTKNIELQKTISKLKNVVKGYKDVIDALLGTSSTISEVQKTNDNGEPLYLNKDLQETTDRIDSTGLENYPITRSVIQPAISITEDMTNNLKFIDTEIQMYDLVSVNEPNPNNEIRTTVKQGDYIYCSSSRMFYIVSEDKYLTTAYREQLLERYRRENYTDDDWNAYNDEDNENHQSILDAENEYLTSLKEKAFTLFDSSDETLVVVENDNIRFTCLQERSLTSNDTTTDPDIIYVQPKDWVLVLQTKSLYQINSTSPLNLTSEDGYTLKLQQIDKTLPNIAIVSNDVERYSLSKKQVQNGDYVKQLDNSTFYRIVDDTNLLRSIGYTVDAVADDFKPKVHIVKNDDERMQLLEKYVRNGDFVRVEKPKVTYYKVIDNTQLDKDAGYELDIQQS